MNKIGVFRESDIFHHTGLSPVTLIRETNNMEELKLNLGGARQTPAGWVNVDYALGARIAKLPLFLTVNKRMKIFICIT